MSAARCSVVSLYSRFFLSFTVSNWFCDRALEVVQLCQQGRRRLRVGAGSCDRFDELTGPAAEDVAPAASVARLSRSGVRVASR
jgi:hypothetical protein